MRIKKTGTIQQQGTVKSMRAGLVYTASNFINKGIVFLSMPLFTRLLTHDEFGAFNNFTAWANVLIILASLDLIISLNRARYDFGQDYNGFVSSVSITSLMTTAVLYLIICCFPGFFVRFFGMEMHYIHLLFLYLFIYPAINYFQVQQRMEGKYKLFAVISVTNSALTILISLLLVLEMQNRLLGRVLGYVLPNLAYGLVLYIVIFIRGRQFRWKYIKYALVISLPMIPSTLSSGLLSSADRIMITNYVGSDATALYSVAYTISTVVTLLQTSINQAYVPWLFERLSQNRTENIKKTANLLSLLFVLLVVGIMLLAPEALMLSGGAGYMQAIWLMPPVMMGCCFLFAYTLYVNVEMFLKKSIQISANTVIAATTNIVLNLLFIPRYGYIAAAYTTLVSYAFLHFLHFFAIRRTPYRDLYNNRFLWGVMLTLLVSLPVFLLLYRISLLRYIALVIYFAAIFILFLKRKKLMKLILT
jgi:O-antigen/teichoic acid export membrane protein